MWDQVVNLDNLHNCIRLFTRGNVCWLQRPSSTGTMSYRTRDWKMLESTLYYFWSNKKSSEMDSHSGLCWKM